MADHPLSIYVREEALVEGVLRFLAERVFGPARREFLEQDLQAMGPKEKASRDARIAALSQAIEGIETGRQDRSRRSSATTTREE